MAFIYRDILTPSVHRFNMYSKLYQRFNKYWGTHMEGTVQVYNDKLVFWDEVNGLRTDKQFKRLINAMGIEYSSLEKESFSGAKNVFLTFDLSKLNFRVLSNTEIAPAFSNAFNIDDIFELSIIYTGATDRLLPEQFLFTNLLGDNDTSNILNYTIDTAAIKATLEADPVQYFVNSNSTPSGQNIHNAFAGITQLYTNQEQSTSSISIAPITAVKPLGTTTQLATLALLDNSTTFQKIGITDESLTFNDDTLKSIRYAYKVKFKVIAEPTETSYIVNRVNSIIQAMDNAYNKNLASLWQIRSSVIEDTSLKKAIYSLMDQTPPTAITYNGFLRVDACAAMKRKDFGKMIGKIIKTDYEETEAEWYEVVIAVVLILIAVVVTVLTFGSAAPGTSTLIAAASALAMGSATLSIGLYMYASAFPTAMDMIRLIGGVAQALGIAASIAGLFSMINNLFQQMQKQALQKYLSEVGTKGMSEEAIKQLSEQFINNYSIGDFIGDLFDHLFDTVTDKLSSFLDLDAIKDFKISDLSEITLKDVSGWLDNLSTGMEMYMKFTESSADKNSKAESEQAEKEDGVEAYYGSLEMLDEVDALYRMDNMMNSSLGLNKTEEFLTKIY